MPTPTHTVACTRLTRIARDVFAIAFEKPDGFAFRGGQFVLFTVPLPDNPADIQPRAYSIASAPQEDELLFVIKLLPGGRMSRWLEETATIGATLSMQGPFGNFLLRQDGRDILYVATSTGIAPFRSHILEAVSSGDRRRMDVVFGVRGEEDLFWKDEIDALARIGNNVFVHVALSQPSADWKGHKGRVQTLVPLIARDLAKRSVYVCGSPPMTKEVKTLCLEQWGVPKEQFHGEAYI